MKLIGREGLQAGTHLNIVETTAGVLRQLCNDPFSSESS